MIDNQMYVNVLLIEKEGDWDRAHTIIQEIASPEAAWIHAYLHRKEGDRWNANYWYTRAGKPYCEASLGEEWNTLFEFFSGTAD